MGKKIPSEVDYQIIALWYEGRPRGYIEQDTGTSAGHINDVIDKERQKVGKGNVEALRRLAIAVGKSGHTPGDIMDGIRLRNGCAIHNNMDVDAVIEALPHLDRICRKYETKLEDLPLDIERQLAEVKDLENKKQALQQEIIQSSEQREAMLKKAKTTEEGLERFNAFRERLEKRGIPFDAPEKLENAIANAEAANYDAKMIVDQVSSCNSLVERKKKIASEYAALENRVQQNKELIEQQTLTIDRNSAMTAEISELKSMGIGLQQVKNLKRMVTEGAAAHGLEPLKAMEKLLDDIKHNYDRALGLAVKIEQSKSELAKVEAETDKLRMEYTADRQAVEALKVLHSKGIKNHDLVAIKAIVENYGPLDLAKLEDEIIYFGSLKIAIAKLQHEKKMLEKAMYTLHADIEQLEIKKAILETSYRGVCAELHEEISNSIAAVGGLTRAANTAVDTIDKTTHRTKAKIEEIGICALYTTEDYKRSRDFLDL